LHGLNLDLGTELICIWHWWCNAHVVLAVG